MRETAPRSRIHGLGRPKTLAILLCVTVARVAAALQPDELLLVCNADLPESRDLAAYYAKVRHIPEGRICGLHLGERAGEEIDPDNYERLVRQPIRAFLNDHKLIAPVRCLVTFYGLPIRIGGDRITPEKDKIVHDLQEQIAGALDELERATIRMESIGKPKPASLPVRKPTLQDYASVMRRYGQAGQAVNEQLARITDPAEKAKAFQALFELIKETEGTSSVLSQVQISGGRPDDERHQALDKMRKSAQEAEIQLAQRLRHDLNDPERPSVRKVVREYHGLVGLLVLLENDIQYVQPKETEAALDSELTLLWYERYPHYRWIPNLLSWTNRTEEILRQQYSQAFWNTRVMMVSRLDASNPKVVRRMIDDALSAERKGLKGNIYLDSRGLYKDAAYAQYDGSLRDLELIIRRKTKLDVTLDQKPEVFRLGACPNTMLYCGWYSLRNYVDSFTFVPGAVAFHIASFEAISLKNPGERGWCKNLLDSGAAATLGPVAEPYLHSFPLPKEFFGLLLTGRFTLVECYAYTTNLNSWMQMLLGDPLYRPFAARPQLSVEQIFLPARIPPEFRPGSTLAAIDPASMPAPATSSPSNR